MAWASWDGSLYQCLPPDGLGWSLSSSALERRLRTHRRAALLPGPLERLGLEGGKGTLGPLSFPTCFCVFLSWCHLEAFR